MISNKQAKAIIAACVVDHEAKERELDESVQGVSDGTFKDVDGDLVPRGENVTVMANDDVIWNDKKSPLKIVNIRSLGAHAKGNLAVVADSFQRFGKATYRNTPPVFNWGDCRCCGAVKESAWCSYCHQLSYNGDEFVERYLSE